MKKLRKAISSHWYNGEWLDILELAIDKMKDELQFDLIKKICKMKWLQHKNDTYIARKLYLSERQVRRLAQDVLMVGLVFAVLDKKISI